MIYVLGNYYISSYSTQNSLSLIKITKDFAATEISVEISDLVHSDMPFKHLDVTN